MPKYVIATILITMVALSGCQEEQPLIKATIGNAGSLSDFYIMSDVSIQTTGGGWTGFSYGAVNGYPGKSADIGKMGVPAHIKGVWSKGWSYDDELVYYRIDAPIDAELAEKKIRTLQNYYKDYQPTRASMQVIVDEERIQVMFTVGCYSYRMDCSPSEDADPNGWVVMNPSSTTEVVVLFDGKGESSPVPFE
ncbi:hypothetical protein CWN94_02305 [Vibrio splendidus]|uniref:hypothetical protein n=1 Tax=Vibrio TaxID=662 RepID=UPI000D388008|nr:hypothetical protein [Vibrio splendidus]PTO56424.1 hypothetical protein CWN94_02305 [Vibrio splendidus]PTO94351.1 hypothetical protein CWO29_00960 [Vibrio splendidus]